MKKTFILMCCIATSAITFSQSFSIGNNDVSQFNKDSGYFKSNYLVGSKSFLSKEATLNSVSLIGKETDARVKMAIYNDKDGKPFRLITNTEATSVKKGVNKLKVNSIKLKSGNYWVMAVYSTSGNHIYTNTLKKGVSKEVYYTALDFNSSIPSNASDFKNYENHDFAYALNFNENVFSPIKELNKEVLMYPNPVSTFLDVSNLPEKLNVIEILSFSGILVKSIQTSENKLTINFVDIPSGQYFVSVNGKKTKRIVKR